MFGISLDSHYSTPSLFVNPTVPRSLELGRNFESQSPPNRFDYSKCFKFSYITGDLLVTLLKGFSGILLGMILNL